MHLSSLEKMKDFRQRYLSGREDEALKIVDLGSVSIGGDYRCLFEAPQWEYIGVDLVAGKNVDLVLSDPYSWIEIPTGSIDVLVSGQALEHIAFFWKTMREVDRILKPGGLCCLIAPSSGPEHRYPIDCWRFYPDGFRSLAQYVGFEVIHVATDWQPARYEDDSYQWADTVLIAKKPEMKANEDIPRDHHVYDRVIDEHGGDSLGKILNHIPGESEILELGPATGYLTRHLKNQLHCTVDAVDISAEMAEQAEGYCRTMIVADLEKTDLAVLFKGHTYDRIIIADVLEHLKHAHGVLRACRRLLKTNGKCLISIPNISHAAIIGSLLKDRFEYTTEGLLDRTHVHFFTRDSIIRLLKQAGFSIDSIETVQVLPEDTEIADSLTDFPPAVQKAILFRKDALTYQFVIACTPKEAGVADNLDDTQEATASAMDLRRIVLKQQNDLIKELSEKSESLEKMALERLNQISRLSEEKRMVEHSYRQAERIAIDRLDALTRHREKIGDYAKGLAKAQRLAFERLDKIDQLLTANKNAHLEIDRMAGELRSIKSTRWFRLYDRFGRWHRSTRSFLS